MAPDFENMLATQKVEAFNNALEETTGMYCSTTFHE